jgi:putative flippase GtrA
MTAAPGRKRREAGRFFKFAVVGVIGAVIDFGTFNILIRFTALGAVVASVISFIAAVSSNFGWNRFWTYPDSRSKPLGRQAGQFLFVSVVGLAIRTPLIAFLQAPMTRFAAWLIPQAQSAAGGANLPVTPEALGANLALATAVVIVLFWNFLANRLWTYSDVE